jgi:hypothetical protein
MTLRIFYKDIPTALLTGVEFVVAGGNNESPILIIKMQDGRTFWIPGTSFHFAEQSAS